MNRRAVLCALGIAAAMLLVPAWAQQAGDVHVVGLLVTHAAVSEPLFDDLRAGLRELGHEDGRNLRLEVVTAEGKLDRLPDLARELLRRKAEVIIAPNEAATRAAVQATRTVPIVMVGGTGYDPVALGIVESFGRPGGNVTGMYGLWSELEVKRLALLREALPTISVVAVMLEPRFGRGALARLQGGAKRLGVRLEPIEVRTPDDLATAFHGAKTKRAGAAILMTSSLFYVNRVQIGALSLQAKLPVISPFNPSVEAGALMSYGADLPAVWKRVAYYVDRLLRGAAASELPVEQIWELKLAVNLRTAKALGITIPESILLRADEVIQ